MRVVEYIKTLSTDPRHQGDEYEYTSDFLEWFYTNIYLEHGCQEYPHIYRVIKEPKYNNMKELCAKFIDKDGPGILGDYLINYYHRELKEWTIETLLKYADE